MNGVAGAILLAGRLPSTDLVMARLDYFRIADHPGVIGIVTRTEMRYLSFWS